MFYANRMARPVLMAAAALSLGALPVLAEETTVTESTTKQSGGVAVSTTTTTTTSTRNPMMVVTNTSGQSTTVPAVFPILLKRFTASNGISIYYPCARADMSIRRDDLLARIISERSAGKIDTAEADAFIARLQAIEARRPSEADFSETTEYFRRALNIYNDYDRVAQDLQTESKQGNKQLAARYHYDIVM